MPKRQKRPFHFNRFMTSSGHWGSKRGLRRLLVTADPENEGRFIVHWPLRKRSSRNSGLCPACDRRTRVRHDGTDWRCRRCGSRHILQLRSADDPERMTPPTRLAHYLNQKQDEPVPAVLARYIHAKPQAIERLTPKQRRRLVHKAEGRMNQFRGPDRPLSKQARRELAEEFSFSQRSHP